MFLLLTLQGTTSNEGRVFIYGGIAKKLPNIDVSRGMYTHNMHGGGVTQCQRSARSQCVLFELSNLIGGPLKSHSKSPGTDHYEAE